MVNRLCCLTRWHLVSLAAIFSAISLWLASASPSRSAPRPDLDCAPQIFDVGDISSANPLEATFQLSNTSESPITIVDARGDCSCTSVRVEERILAPGDRTRLFATLKLDSASGAVRHAILVEYKAEKKLDTGVLDLWVRARVH